MRLFGGYIASRILLLLSMAAIKFGTDGWRDVIAEDFTFANARIVAKAIARYVVRCEDARKGVLIGYDHRFASDSVAAAVAEVIASTGTPVWLADKPCPTPAISLLVRQRAAAGGILITASHNPYQWNGIKYKASYGSSALPSIVAQIEIELAEVQKSAATPLPPRKELIQSLEPRAPYLDTIEKLIDWQRLRDAKLRFVSDPMHGSATGLLPALFARNGIACDEIRGTRDPLFGGVHPEPIPPHIDPLQKAVLAGKYDAGLCADGDGDRIGAVDRDGSFVNPHQIFALLVWHLAGTRNLPGDIAKTFSVTKLIDKLAAKFGRKLHEVPIGFKYICELMLEQNILIGGEESGGIGTSLYLARTRRHSLRAFSGRTDGLARQVSRRYAARALQRIRRIPLRPRRPRRHTGAETKSYRAFFQREDSHSCSTGPSPAAKIWMASKSILAKSAGFWFALPARRICSVFIARRRSKKPRRRVLDAVAKLVRAL